MSKKEVNKTNGKKKIFIIVILVVLIPLLLFFGYKFITNKIDETNAAKMGNTINELARDKVDYVFVDINPSFMLTIKENKVSEVSCLNDDCKSVYNDIDVKGKNVNDSIDNIYNVTKSKGFDVSNGVNVKTTGNVEIEEKEYVTVEYISESTKNEMISNVDDLEIEVISNDEYYNKTLEELKKDSDYGNTYVCNMNNDELECYVNDKYFDKYFKVSGSDVIPKCNTDESCEKLADNVRKDVVNIFRKFGVETKGNEVYINGVGYSYNISSTYSSVLYRKPEKEFVEAPQELCDGAYLRPSENGKCEVRDGARYIIPLDKVNLLKPNASSQYLVTEGTSATDIINTALEAMNRHN